MSDSLPASWATAPIGDICETVSKRGPDVAKSNFRYVDLSSIDRATKSIANASTIDTESAPSRAKQVLATGDVLFSNVRVYLENIAQVPDDLDGEIGSTAFCVLRPAKSIESRYLYHFVTSSKFVITVDALQRGNSPPSVQDSDVRQQALPIAPSNEQRRIVSKIDELFSRIDEGEQALQRVEKLVERYRQSVLKAAVTGELTRDWREARKRAGEPVESSAALLARILKARRAAWEAAELKKMKTKGKMPIDDRWKQKYKEPEPPDTADLPELPKGWVWASMEQLVSEFGNGLSRKPAESPPGLPILRISAVRSMSVDASDVRYYVQKTGEVISGFKVLKGDLLFTRYNGSKALVGVSGVYDTDAPVLHPDKLIKARVVDRELVLPSFLAIACNAGESWKHISSWVKTSAGQHGIAGSDIKRTPIPLPPRVEQERISASVERGTESSASMWAAGAAEARRSAALRQSILKAAFSGQLVPQDPNDEPAEKLLDRIAAERAVAAPVSRKRTKNTA